MIATRKDKRAFSSLRVCTSFAALSKKNFGDVRGLLFSLHLDSFRKLSEEKKRRTRHETQLTPQVTRRTRWHSSGWQTRKKKKKKKKKEWEGARRNRTRCGGLPPTLPLLLLLLLLLSINIHEVAALRPFRPYHSAASRPA